jgi:hypothetical protein
LALAVPVAQRGLPLDLVTLGRMGVTRHLVHFLQLMVVVALLMAVPAVMAAAFYPRPTLQQLLEGHYLQQQAKQQANLTGR